MNNNKFWHLKSYVGVNIKNVPYNNQNDDMQCYQFACKTNRYTIPADSCGTGGNGIKAIGPLGK
jgi:hypothetical protein